MSTLRPIILSLLILALVAGGLPVSDSLARWSRRPSVSRTKGKHVRRRHSRAWWRRRRAWLKRRRALAARRRPRPLANASPRPLRDSATNLDTVVERAASTNSSTSATNSNVLSVASPNASMASNAVANTRLASAPAAVNSSKRERKSSTSKAAEATRSRVPYDLTLPGSWSSSAAGSAPGEMRFAIRTVDGRMAGTASLTPVRITNFDVPQAPRMKSLAGVPLNVLRRTVIDRMAAEGGWVVNDTEREFEGRRIYVVFARTSKPGGAEQALTFYFTEVDGRVYSLATNTAVELAEPVASASEKIVATFRLSGSGGSTAAAQGLR